MQQRFNPYVVLGVSRTCDARAIRAAYKALIVRFHPDTNRAPDAAERAAEINAAFDVLSDPYKRAAFDVLSNPYRRGAYGGLRRLPANVPAHIHRPPPIEAERSRTVSRGALASAGAAALVSVVAVWFAEVQATTDAVSFLDRGTRAMVVANIADVRIANVPIADVRRVVRKALRTAVPAANAEVIAPTAAAVERIVDAAVPPIRMPRASRQVAPLARPEALTTVPAPARSGAPGHCGHRHRLKTSSCGDAQGGGWSDHDSQAMASLDEGPPEVASGNIREIDPTPVAQEVLDAQREPEMPRAGENRSKPQGHRFRYRYRHIGAAPGRPAYPRD